MVCAWPPTRGSSGAVGHAPCRTAGITLYRAPDQLHWDAFNDGGDRGFAYAVNSILEGVAPQFDQLQQVAGEFGDPFSAGKMATYWTGGGVGSTIPRIKDRFSWGLGPIEEGDRGGAPHHFTNQGQYCTATAEKNGLVEECAETLLFFAGPEVQGRIAIDRGSLPMLKTVITSDEFKAGPPDNHGYYKTWMDKTDHHHWQNGHPNWWEWYESFRAADPPFIGDMSIEQGMQHIIDTIRPCPRKHEGGVRLLEGLDRGSAASGLVARRSSITDEDQSARHSPGRLFV